MIRRIKKLTTRELEILRLVGEGHTTIQMAQKLFISTETVRTHRKRILRKTKAKSMISVVLYAVQADVINITAMLR